MLKILIAPNMFKECLSAEKVALAIEAGIKKFSRRTITFKLPLSDGGEGFVETLMVPGRGRMTKVKVTGPLKGKVTACFGIMDKGATAVIEMAKASGLALVPKAKRDPCLTHTYGTGELILAALRRNCRKIIIGLGNSATVDGGTGMARALGIRFLNTRGKEIGLGGEALRYLHTIDASSLHPGIKSTNIIAACDVRNPLFGPDGAAFIFGPQKGADKKMVLELDRNLRHLAGVIKKDLKKDIARIPGAGAAGGLGAGLLAFLNARLVPGMDIIRESTDLEEKIKRSDLVITGEGRVDSQTLQGKATYGILKMAKKWDKPVLCIAGSIQDPRLLYRHGFKNLIPITRYPMNLEESIKNAEHLIADAVCRAMHCMYME